MSGEDATTDYRFDDVVIDCENFRVEKNGCRVTLTPRAFDVLRYLVEHRGRVVEKQELFENFWKDSFVTDNALTRVVKEIRQTIGDCADAPRFIETVPKRGYRFVAPVHAPDKNVQILAAEYTVTDVSIEEEIIEPDEQKLLSPVVSKTGWRRPLLILAFVFPIILGAVGVYRYAFRSSAVPSFENISWRKLTTAGNVYFAILSPNAQFIAYVTIDEKGQTLRLMNIADRTEITLVPPGDFGYWGATFTADSNQIYFIIHGNNNAKGVLYRISILGGKMQKVLENLGGAVPSTDGSRILFTRFDASQNTLKIMTASSADGSDEQLIYTSLSDAAVYPAGFSPDGTKILLQCNKKGKDGIIGCLSEIPATGGDERIIIESRKQRFNAAQWRENGILLSAVTPEGNAAQIYFVSYPDGKISRITNDANSYFAPNASADGRTIVAAQQERLTDAWIWDGGAAAPRRITYKNSGIGTLVWTPDGGIIYDFWDNGKSRLWTMNADGGNEKQITADQVEAIRPAISPDGRLMAFLSNRTGGRWQIWRTNAEGGEPLQLTDAFESKDEPRFALYGTQIIYKRYVNGFWSLARIPTDGGEPVALTENGNVGEWNVSPDGELLAYHFEDPEHKSVGVSVLSLRDLNRISHLNLAPYDFLAFMPDNKSLITKQLTGSAAPQSTVWQFPLDGGKPQILVSNPPDTIYQAEYSRDGKHLAWVQGKLVSNVVLLSRQE